MPKRIWIKISVDTLLADIAYKEANGFDFEARVLKGLIRMTTHEKEVFETYLASCKASKARRDAGYPPTK
jgi:hypothetical protein